MTEPSHAVFLSYASQDAEAAQRICESLRTAGVEVWFDETELRGGDVWDRKIRQQIRDCSLFIPLISRHTQERSEGYFRLEWRLADQRTHLMGRSRAFLVPVCIDEVSERDADVPDSFSVVQWTRLAGGTTPPAFVERIQRLLMPSGAFGPAYQRVATDPIVQKPAATPILAGHEPAPATAHAFSLTSAAPRTSLAVLPLANLTGDPDKEYFGDGMAEELINMLTRMPGLQVPARTSSFAYKGRHTDVRQIARELGVDALLEGSVRSAGNRIRLTVQLVDGRNGYHLWSQNYDRDFGDLFALQDELASAIVQAIRSTLNGTVDTVTRPPPAHDVEAYQLYLRGRALLERGTEENLRRAVELLQQAVARDPAFARAYGAMALAHWVAFFFNYPVSDALADAERAAQRALALDPKLAEAHGVLGSVCSARLEWLQADASLRAARALGENDAYTRTDHAMHVGMPVGHLRQAEYDVRAAHQQAPANALVALRLGTVLLMSGSSEAVKYLDLSVDFGFPKTLYPMPIMLGFVALRGQRYAEAADFYAQDLMVRTVGAKKAVRLVMSALATGTGTAEAIAALETVESQADPRALAWATLGIICHLYAVLGEIDHAYQAANRLLDERTRSGPVWLAAGDLWNPEMRPFRQDPRFQALVTRFGLMPYWEKYGPPDGCELHRGRLVCP